MSKNELLEKRCEELIKELDKEFHSPNGGFLFIMDNGKDFGHIAFSGRSSVIEKGLKQAMFENGAFRNIVCRACESVLDELEEEMED